MAMLTSLRVSRSQRIGVVVAPRHRRRAERRTGAVETGRERGIVPVVVGNRNGR
jgi:hypothetical protein